MNYQITIVRKEPDPNFEKQFEEWKERERSRYGAGPGEYPKEETVKNAMMCELTEAQFEAFKRSVLECFS